MPVEPIKRLSPFLTPAGLGLDAALARLAALDPDDPALGLGRFERRLLRAAQDDLAVPAASRSLAIWVGCDLLSEGSKIVA